MSCQRSVKLTKISKELNMKIEHIVGILLVMLYSTSIAQQSETVIPPSPDAAALGMYGNIPVSCYTGVPNINIPLHEIKYRDINLPISLSYHASGITVEQEASWVGLGWALNFGGIITRTIRGGDDMQFIHDGYCDIGYLYTDYRGYPYDNLNQASGSFQLDICQKHVDPEPDIFYYNFFGKSGSFVLENGQSSSVSFLLGTPLEVEKIEIKYDKTTFKWIIKTADGYSYHLGTVELTETLHGGGSYGQGPDKIRFSSTNHGFISWDDIAVTSWYLDKIVTPQGEEVNYIYDTVDGGTNGMPSGHKYSLFGSAKSTINEIKKTSMANDLQGFCYLPPDQTPSTKTFTGHIYLKEIQYSLGKIVFNKSLRGDMLPATQSTTNVPYMDQPPYYMTWLLTGLGPQKLDNAVVLDNAGNTIKRIEFEYDYFNSQVNTADKYDFKRLKLSRVRACGSQACNPYHQFYYYESSALPSKFSNAQDFWGYYNGQNYNQSKIPYGTFFNINDNKFYYLGDSDRQPNAEYMVTGTLNKIIYPTGGFSEFEFEPHDYSVFGDDAFTVTDFNNNVVNPVGELITSAADASPYQTFTFTVTAQSQDIVLDQTMTYYPSATSSTPCSVTDPGTYYVGTELWYELTTSTGTVASSTMADFLSYFSSNYNHNCVSTPYTPELIEPIYSKKKTLLLAAGTYQLKVYRRNQFNLHVLVSNVVISPRTVTQNSQGIFAKTAGGLRIRKVKTQENSNGIPQIRKYVYAVPGLNNQTYSTGRLMLYPSYHVPQYCENPENQGASLIAYIGRSWNHIPLGTSASGSIVGYDKVIEVQGELGENGKTEFAYENHEEESNEPIQFIEGLPTKKFTNNGLLRELKVFDKDQNLLKTEISEYQRQLQKEIVGVAFKQLIYGWAKDQFSFTCLADGYLWAYLMQNYSIISDRWVKSKKIERSYSSGSPNPIEITTDYVYDSFTHLQLKSEQSTSSTSDTRKISYTYPAEASWIPTGMWQNQYVQNVPVLKEVYKNATLLSTYKASYTNSGTGYNVTKEEIALGANPLETTTDYTYYATGNLKELLLRSGDKEVYLWGYNNAYPIARIRNATSAEVLVGLGNITESSLNSFAAAITPSSDYLSRISNLRTMLPKSILETFSYQPLKGLLSKSDANGQITSFEYDGIGRLQVIKDSKGNVLKSFNYHYKGQ
jgi:YD repeat-containing protein